MATDEPLLVCKQNRNQLATKKLIAPPDKLAVESKEIVKKKQCRHRIRWQNLEPAKLQCFVVTK
jgi:hypothetical protein